MHEEWEIKSLPSEENLEKAWRNLKDQDWSEMRLFGREKRELSRERSNEMKVGSHRKNIWNLSKARQLKVSKGVKTSVEEDVEKDNVDRLSYRVGVKGHINKG